MPGAGRARLLVEPSVVDEEPDPETPELLAVTREPGAAVEAVEAVGELEGLRGCQRVPGRAFPLCLERVVLVDAPELALAALEDRQLEDAPGPCRAQAGVRQVVGVGRARAQREDEQVGGDQRQQHGSQREPPALADSREQPRTGEGGERREGERGQRQEAAWHPRVAQRREDVAQRLVERQVRPQREQRRDEGRDAEDDRQAPVPPCQEHEPGDGEHRREPPEIDELLEAVQAPPAEKVDRVGGVGGHLGELPPLRGRRPLDHGRLGQEAGPDGDGCASPRPERRDEPVAHGRVHGDERERPEREMELPRERDRDQSRRRERAPRMRPARRLGPPRPLEGPQRQRDEHSDPAEQVAAALHEPVRRDPEGKPSQRGGRERKLELTEPQVGEEARQEGHGQHQEVPRHHRPEERLERPEREAVGPAAEDDLRLDERLVAVRVPPRLGAGLELMTHQPEAVGRLEMVARGRLAVARQARGNELRAEVEHRRERRDDGGDGEERRHEKAGAHAGMMHGAVTIGRYQRSARSRPRDDRRRVSRGGDGRRGSHPSGGRLPALAGRGRLGADHDRADHRRRARPRRGHGVDAATLVRARVDRRAGRPARRGGPRHRRRGERPAGRARRRLRPPAPPALGGRARRPHRRARGPARPARGRAARLRALRAARARLRLAPRARRREALVGEARRAGRRRRGRAPDALLLRLRRARRRGLALDDARLPDVAPARLRVARRGRPPLPPLAAVARAAGRQPALLVDRRLLAPQSGGGLLGLRMERGAAVRARHRRHRAARRRPAGRRLPRGRRRLRGRVASGAARAPDGDPRARAGGNGRQPLARRREPLHGAERPRLRTVRGRGDRRARGRPTAPLGTARRRRVRAGRRRRPGARGRACATARTTRWPHALVELGWEATRTSPCRSRAGPTSSRTSAAPTPSGARSAGTSPATRSSCLGRARPASASSSSAAGPGGDLPRLRSTAIGVGRRHLSR